jgi:hypothetical protein
MNLRLIRNVSALQHLRKFSNGSLSSFVISEKPGKGKVMIASKDCLPGHTLFTEVPLLMATVEDMEKFAPLEPKFQIPKSMWAMHDNFTKLSPEAKCKVLDLFGPIDGAKATQMRSLMSGEATQRNWDVATFDNFIKVGMIQIFSSFGAKSSAVKLFEYASRINHSCLPNCIIDQEYEGDVEGEISCVVIKPVKAGDEITFCYSEDIQDKTQLERKAFLMASKEFVCDCPRCSAPGCFRLCVCFCVEDNVIPLFHCR